MKKLGRNDPCPCGSGKKLKRCCLSSPFLDELGDIPFGARVKGGVAFDQEAGAWVPVIHIWDSPECSGEPREHRSAMVFAEEEQAWAYYNAAIGPRLATLIDRLQRESPDLTVFRYEQ